MELPTLNNFGSFADWVSNLNEDEISKSPDQYYQKICNTIWHLRDEQELDGAWTDNFESVLGDEFFKILESLQLGLEYWKSNLNVDEYANLSSDSELNIRNFEEINYFGEKQPPIELQKIWHNFNFWGRMWTGEHAPKHGKFITIFENYETKLRIVKILLLKTKEIIANTNY